MPGTSVMVSYHGLIDFRTFRFRNGLERTIRSLSSIHAPKIWIIGVTKMDIACFLLKSWIVVSTLLWITTPCNAVIPTRTSTEFISGSDASLNLTNASRCANFSVEHGVNFQRMIIHENGLYIGGTNHILQVDLRTFELDQYKKLGPYDDDPECLSPSICSKSCGKLKCTDNENRLMMPHRDALLVCGSAYAGTCDILTLSNISQPYQPSPSDAELKCKDETSQITNHTGPLAVAGLFTHPSEPKKDLFYLGNGKDPFSVDVLFPPDAQSLNPVFRFSEIVKSSFYASGTKQRKYITQVTTDSHNYMLWTSTEEEDSVVRTVISRLCHNTLNQFSRTKVENEPEENFGRNSYTETNVACSGRGIASLAYYRYGRLYVMMSDGSGNQALCSAMLSQVEKHIEDARRACFGADTTKAEYISGAACTKFGAEESVITCGLPQDLSQFINSLRCKEVLELREEFVWPESTDGPTSIAVDLFDGSSIAFFGTKNGHLLKAKIGKSATTFSERITLESNLPVLHDVGFDEPSKHIYAMSPNKVFKIKLSQCEQYDTCGKCVSSGDPYCGWCVLQSRCTHKTECSNAADRQYWLDTKVDASQCPSVSMISPNSLSVAIAKELTLAFGGRALPDRSYSCDFVVDGNSVYTSPLQNFSSAPTCSSPETPPSIPDGQDHVNVTLQIKADGAVVATGRMNIYNCREIPKINKQAMCGACVTSPWNCVWCVNTNTCEDECSSADDGITAQSECPVLRRVVNAPIDVPVGKPHQFTILTENLPQADAFTCVLDVCKFSSQVTVPGIRDGDNITCNIQEKRLNCPREDSTIVFSLKSGSYYVDTPTPQAVTVGLFNCTVTQAECGLCIVSHKRQVECGWCVNSGTCIPQEDCQGEVSTSIQSCPKPTIDSLSPFNGPKNGGTEITVVGKNLASSFQEIDSMFVRDENGGNGDVNCTILAEKYVPSKRIVCRTQATGTIPSGGKVHIKMTYFDEDLVSKEEFKFKEVSVSRFKPKYAMLGTKVTVDGVNLDVGNDAIVKIQSGNVELSSQCNDRTPDRLVCRLPLAPSTGQYVLWTYVDGFSQEMNETIEYVEKPNITKLIGRDKLISFYSGGLVAKFEFTSLLGIQTVVLKVNNGDGMEDCQLDFNTTSVACPIPPMNPNESGSRKRSKRALSSDDSRAAAPTVASGEIVINREFIIPLSGNFDLSYVSDPVVNPMSSLPCRTADTPTQRTVQDDPPTRNGTAAALREDDDSEESVAIQLTGKHLDDAAVEEDYSVLISPLEGEGSVECVSTFLDSGNLICKAPTAELSEYEGMTVRVVVRVGNLTFQLEAEYCPGGGDFDLLAIIVPIAVIFVILVVIIIVLLLLHRRRAQKQKKEREQIMLMLDTLENKTRETARKAYFELQLGYMTTFTENLSDRITYLPPVSCFTRALFNDWKPDHPMLRSKTNDGLVSLKSGALDEFILLLKNKDFLLTLVKTLEEQKHFTVKEKGHFASLLTVCLFDDMVYFTKVMMELLSDLIQKHVGKNPKLLLRRSESVVEKMVSHWLCINLYSQCIKDQAGKPLFLLTKAIHFLVNSAPSDVVANKALNSLNEMTLLGTEVTYDVMTLKSSVIERGQKSEVIDVKVVNCDTITQVKEKIIEAVYRDLPYSEYPKPDQMELELVAGQGHLVLSDIDNMSHREGNYTRINTLKHYNVPDGAEVVLSPIKPEMNGTAETGSPPPEPKRKRLYHLIHPRDKEPNGFVEEDDSGNKTKALIGNLINQPFQEIYLTRMVKSKTTVQEYVDGVFNAILAPVPISRAVKYFFQFLDREAAKHKISDPEVVHIWKTNSLLLRYWVNILKNPEFLFDVNKTAIVDSCLNVITQAFMDACTTTNHKLGQDSPSNKLLYAKDAERYRGMVMKFFENVANEESTGEEELFESLREVSKNYAQDFDSRAAAQQLFDHLDKYRSQVQEAIESDSMRSKLNDVIAKVSPETVGHTHETSVLI